APVVSAITQNAADVDPNVVGLQIFTGTGVEYSGSASDPKGAALSWQWLYTVNGGAEVVLQKGTGTVAAVSYTYGATTAGNTYVWKLRVSNGTATSESQLTVGVEAPPAAGQGLTFEAESGTIKAPFVATNGYIYQAVQTGTNGGRAAYSFSITNAGSYVIQALVNAPNDAANSFYVNIDAEPQDPSMTWQIPITAGFENRIVNWQGSGTWDNPQFVPRVFTLTQGTHQLIIRGREAGTQLDRFAILKVPQAPQGLRVVASP
ncbi:MAG: Fibronectin, type domain protein, partial [Pedosphaera sp.]|nr:Fibronectin, type domain protein [Pedosphaera sp.]